MTDDDRPEPTTAKPKPATTTNPAWIVDWRSYAADAQPQNPDADWEPPEPMATDAFQTETAARAFAERQYFAALSERVGVRPLSSYREDDSEAAAEYRWREANYAERAVWQDGGWRKPAPQPDSVIP